ncbi:MAG: acyl-CoA thioesterase [Bacteroidota bacterium]|nr:acyl-CoA thioesterase [Bacteroidota bacterium]
MKSIFELSMTVRDYECDLQGIVNNAVYQNYLEHARHQFLHSIDLDFAQWHDEGKDAVVIRAELDYKQSLQPGDRFLVRLEVVKKGNLKIDFFQEIVRLSDNATCLQARVSSVVMSNNRPLSNAIFFDVLDKKEIAYGQEK